MAKQLLLNTLVDVFGEYLTGLTAENLQIGVWSGEIKYDDLRVNPAGISKLGLPVDVAHGSIRHFAVSVPWTRLESQPVTVDIDGVYVVARPVDRARLSDDELHRRFIQNKQDAIASALKAAISAAEKGPGGAESKTEEGSGYFARLQRTIVDNIQINVRRVHVRYENATASLGKTLAIGVALEEFKVSSATADFSEAFVQRDARDPVQKVVKLGNLSVYVDGDAEPFGGMAGSPAVEAALEGAILTREAAARLSGSAGTAGAGAGAAEPGFIGALNLAESPRLRSYVLAPFSGEVCFSQVPPGTAANTLTAAMTADVIMDELSVHVSAAQFRALYAVQEEMERLQLFYDMMPHRPTERPTAAPRAWWRYAYRCITHRPNVVSWDDVLRNLSLRKSYVELYTSIAEASEGDAARADELKRDLFEMEGLLPVPTILLFRRRAEQVLARRRRERELEAQRKEGADAAAAAAEEEKPRALSFFQRMGSFMKKEAPKRKAAPATLSSELGDIDLGTLAASVSGPDAEAPSRPDGITMVACFNASASVQLSTVDFAPIVRFDVSVGGALAATPPAPTLSRTWSCPTGCRVTAGASRRCSAPAAAAAAPRAGEPLWARWAAAAAGASSGTALAARGGGCTCPRPWRSWTTCSRRTARRSFACTSPGTRRRARIVWASRRGRCACTTTGPAWSCSPRPSSRARRIYTPCSTRRARALAARRRRPAGRSRRARRPSSCASTRPRP